MIPPTDILRWVVQLDNGPLRAAYTDALCWLYEAEQDPTQLPVMSRCVVDLTDRYGKYYTDEDVDPDDIAAAILLEIAGRWVHDQDTPR